MLLVPGRVRCPFASFSSIALCFLRILNAVDELAVKNAAALRLLLFHGLSVPDTSSDGIRHVPVVVHVGIKIQGAGLRPER